MLRTLCRAQRPTAVAALAAPALRTARLCSSVEQQNEFEWRSLGSGLQQRQVSYGDQDDEPVHEGQTVRIGYTARLEDGTVVTRNTASFKIGSAGRICDALDEGVRGMRVGDRRLLRAPQYLNRGPALDAAPQHAIIEYEVQLTGSVHHMKIVTLDPPGSDDPLQVSACASGHMSDVDAPLTLPCACPVQVLWDSGRRWVDKLLDGKGR